ncbi:protein O-linked-mannose beta-1,2-N-acetylglucosaminyltransferase 1-like [Halichondria panicea]|uniref:protein O-linked-mannose beta-1,2-N-acetylglucosaminyltransferase 1-like n=1 Tax=Halichondria panicea TaxID=6063 RepID=UPI00312B480F
MIHIRRNRWKLFIIFVILMLTLNIVFIVDLTMNHQATDHIIGIMSKSVVERSVEVEPRRHGNTLIAIRVISDKEMVEIYVKNQLVHSSKPEQRGIHVAVLNQATGALMAVRVFDTYSPGSEDVLITFLNTLSDGRILCLAIQDEGSFHLKEAGRGALAALGSHLSSSLSWRDMWALVTVKGAGPIAEDVGKSVDTASWGSKVTLDATVPLKDSAAFECDWPATAENIRRKAFCSKYEGYGQLCNCATPISLTLSPPNFSPNHVADVPVTIIASNRPQYLYRMIRSLLSAHGSSAAMVTVFIDGFYQEPAEVASLFGIRAIHHEPKSQKNGRISQHYKASLSQTFDLYPTAEYTVVLEEDLEVSPDLFSYFSQTLQLLREDETVYCVSAWNDQGYDHSCQDPTMLYRVETMPGLGWLLKKKLFKQELEPNWPGPDKLWDWDMWMRIKEVRKGRECIIPDISRTYHFGASGVNMNPYFQEHYFKRHTLNRLAQVTLNSVDSLRAEDYEFVILSLFRESTVLDHSKNPCDDDFIPDTKDKVYVIFIAMAKENDFDNWMKLATCFHLWDLDARGFHKGVWRFWLKGNQVMVVGHPYSLYSSRHKPSDVQPLTLANTKG